MNPRLFRFPLFALLVTLAIFFGLTPPAAAAPPPPGPEQLADLLENPETRDALIEQLRRSASETEPSAMAALAEPERSFPQQLAFLTQSITELSIREAAATLTALSLSFQRVAGMDFSTFAREAATFAVFVVLVLAVFWLLGRIAARLYRRLDTYVLAAAAHVRALRRTVAIITAIGIHLATVLLTWLAGNSIALPLGGDTGVGMQYSLFLNAFVLVEGVRVILGTLLSDRYPGLRLVPASSEEAAYWNAWVSRMLYFIGYGMMLVVPFVSYFLAPELGRTLALIILLSAFLKTTIILLQNRKRVRASLERLAERMHTTFARVTLATLARVWHIIAIAYASALLIATVFFPEHALAFMLHATLQTVVASLLGIALATILNGIILRRIRLPDDTRQHFPLLESRLNAYVPTVLKITRFVILAVVLAFILDAWTTFDLFTWVQSDAGLSTIATIVTVGFILGLALALWLLSASWIEYRLNPHAGHVGPTPRVQTLLSIFRNAIAIALVVLTTMVVLAELGVNIAPLLAGAGVLGLAIGFGAQKLVQDVITGMFIQLEGAINVGDIVTAGGETGVVEKLTIRSLGIRDLAGTYHLLPFSSVEVVSNFMRDHAFHLGEYHIAYREDYDLAIEHLKAAFEELRKDPEQEPLIRGELEIHGICEFTERSMVVRIRIMTLPGVQWGVGRAYNRLVKRHFDEAGIEIPFPNMTLHFGEDRQGHAPAANIRIQNAGPAPDTGAS